MDRRVLPESNGSDGGSRGREEHGRRGEAEEVPVSRKKRRSSMLVIDVILLVSALTLKATPQEI